MKDAFIVTGARSAFGRFRGSLSGLRADDLLAQVIRSLLDKNSGIPAEAFDDVIMGCANQAGEDNRNVARMSSLLAGMPWSVPAETTNRLCASGMSAVRQAARAIQVGDADLVMCGGIEHMTRAPMVVAKSASPFGSDHKIYDSSFGWRFVNPKMKKLYGTEAMGNTAENLVDLYDISREDQDRFAMRSQHKAAAAREQGRLAEEIVPVHIPRRKQDDLIFDQDEFIRPETSMEALAKLRPAFREDGTVTAGNASGLNDGAAALILASADAVKRYNLEPLARVCSSAVVGVEPRIMGIGPVPAVNKLLEKNQLTLDQIELIELNEAFAAQSLACIRQLGLEDDDPRINVNGGAIAIGHPLGVSGARITYSLALEMKKQNKARGIATMCVGVGQGYAVLLERV
jgi:3-oxoadipyl-CoA thiolase